MKYNILENFMEKKMTSTEAYELIHQLARIAAVNGDIGDKRDEALSVLKRMVDKGQYN